MSNDHKCAGCGAPMIGLENAPTVLAGILEHAAEHLPPGLHMFAAIHDVHNGESVIASTGGVALPVLLAFLDRAAASLRRSMQAGTN